MAKILCAEIEYSVIKLCEMEYDKKNPKVYRCYEIPIEPGLIVDGYMNPEQQLLVVGVIKQALIANKIKTKKIIFTVVSGKIINREILIPAVKVNAIDSVIQSNLTDYFPVDLSEYKVTYTLLDTIVEGRDAGRHRVLVMAAENALVEQYRAIATSCGLTLVNLCYGGDSIFQAMKNSKSEKCQAVVKVEEQYTIITILKNGKMYLQRSVNYGIGEAINEIVNQRCYDADTYEEAWKLSKVQNCASSFEGGADEVGSRAVGGELKALAGSIARIIDYHNSHTEGMDVEEMILVGTGTEFVGLSQVIAEEVDCECKALGEIVGVKCGHLKDTVCAYVACVGAGLSKVGFVYDEAKEKQKKKNNYIPATVLLIIFFIVVIAALVLSAWNLYQEALGRKMDLERKVELYTPAEEVYNQHVYTQTLFNEMTNAHNSTRHTNDSLLNFLDELERKLPAEMEISEFSSDDSQAVLKMRVKDKETAAGVFDTLRGFESVMNVTVESVAEDEEKDTQEDAVEGSQYVEFSISCSYYPIYSQEETTVQ